MKSYYDILDVNINSSLLEIKKSYKFLATKYHPDKHNGDIFFQEKFKELNEAYSVLSNLDSKTKYDTNFLKSDVENFKTQISNLKLEVQTLKTEIKNLEEFKKKSIELNLENSTLRRKVIELEGRIKFIQIAHEMAERKK